MAFKNRFERDSNLCYARITDDGVYSDKHQTYFHSIEGNITKVILTHIETDGRMWTSASLILIDGCEGGSTTFLSVGGTTSPYFFDLLKRLAWAGITPDQTVELSPYAMDDTAALRTNKGIVVYLAGEKIKPSFEDKHWLTLGRGAYPEMEPSVLKSVMLSQDGLDVEEYRRIKKYRIGALLHTLNIPILTKEEKTGKSKQPKVIGSG